MLDQHLIPRMAPWNLTNFLHFYLISIGASYIKSHSENLIKVLSLGSLTEGVVAVVVFEQLARHESLILAKN